MKHFVLEGLVLLLGNKFIIQHFPCQIYRYLKSYFIKK